MDCHRKGKKQSYEGTTVEMPTGFRSARNPARSGPRNPNRLCRAAEAKSARSSRGFRNIGPIAISVTPSASKLSHRPTGASGPWAPRASSQEAAGAGKRGHRAGAWHVPPSRLQPCCRLGGFPGNGGSGVPRRGEKRLTSPSPRLSVGGPNVPPPLSRY